ncbi:hypothetical protein EV192_110263 [Actinocrispum wychmicini]|uniref:Uncharacterized protein n=2 Tax=Actinocrispum wychmicini TaxID=1213861 RepID=A0A4R2J5P4_9PSEU|nr:hypothetical protein EV192_110263 [Actinocrispum wychmicini]
MPDLDLLRELAAARTYYEERFGWPVTIEVNTERLVIPLGQRLDAVVMPEALGSRVLTELRICLLAGPVLADTGGDWWMFLTGPKGTAPKDVADLRCVEVHLPAAGTLVVIPREIGETNGWPWIERPRPLHLLPPWPAVLATTRRTCARIPRIPAPRIPDLIRTR